MKGLSKERLEIRAQLALALQTAVASVQDSVGGVEGAVSVYNSRVDDLNNLLAGAREFVGEVNGDMDEYIAGRSEKWTESDAGEAYSNWKDEWENIELDDVEHIEIEIPAPITSADDLEGLPDQPE